MSFTTVLAQIKTVLEGVSGVKNVHDYPRFTDNITDLDSLYVDGSNFSFWWIDRSSAPTDGGLGSQFFRMHRFDLWYFEAVDDSATSAKTFQQLLDDVMDEFNLTANRDLGGTADLNEEPSELLEVIHGVNFPREGGPLCHRGHIRIIAEEDVTC